MKPLLTDDEIRYYCVVIVEHRFVTTQLILLYEQKGYTAKARRLRDYMKKMNLAIADILVCKDVRDQKVRFFALPVACKVLYDLTKVFRREARKINKQTHKA